MKSIEQVLKFFPLFSLILITLGFYSLYDYYRYFEVSIAEFLTPSEIILSFIPNIFITIGTFSFVFFSIINRINMDDQWSHVPEKKEYKYKSLGYYLSFFFSIKMLKKIRCKGIFKLIYRIVTKWSVIMFLTASILSYALYKEIKEMNFVYFLFKSQINQLSYLWFILIIVSITKNLRSIEVRKINVVFLIAIYVVIMISFNNYCKAWSALSGFGEKKVDFQYNNGAANTDSIYTYVGMTKEYLFLYNNKKAETNVFEKGEITNLKIKKGVDPEKDIKDKYFDAKKKLEEVKQKEEGTKNQ